MQTMRVKKDHLSTIQLPDTPGVYIFKDAQGKKLYIGKATSLKSRVKSYFSKDLIDTRGERVVTMVEKSKMLDWHTTDSVLEALMLEAQLIKKFQPPYNVRERDNKSYNYVVITKEEFPRVLIARGRELFSSSSPFPSGTIFGPYPEGRNLKIALGIIRKIFPYRDTCTPTSGKPCFNAQIGLCPGVCAGMMGAQEYKQQVRHISQFLSAKKKDILRDLRKEQKMCSAAEDFEKAARIQKTIFALEHIRDVALIKEDAVRMSDGGSFRIEAYDISHTAGSEVVGVITTVVNGVIAKEGYRKFILKVQKNDDIGQLREIVTRRLKHSEWPLPDIFVADGGEPQRAALAALLPEQLRDRVVSVLKDNHHKPKDILGNSEYALTHKKAILLANAEAHRFAIEFHRKRMRNRLHA
jgi:excinuclease ABC subunit C